MYILENTVDLPDIGSVGYIYRHKKNPAPEWFTSKMMMTIKCSQ